MATIIQSKPLSSVNMNVATITFDAPFTPNNAIVLLVSHRNYIKPGGSTLASVTSNKAGQTFVRRTGYHRDPYEADSGVGDLWVELWDVLAAPDAAPGTPMIATLTGVTLNANNHCTALMMEVSGLVAFSRVGIPSGGSYNSSSISSLTSTLPSVPQVGFAAMTTFGSNLSAAIGDWTTLLLNNSSATNAPRSSFAWKHTDSLAAVSANWTYDLTIYGAAAIIGTYTAAAGATLRMRFDLSTSTFTAADTAVEGYVWVDGFPDTKLGVYFNNLAGNATAGQLVIPNTHPNWPVGLVAGTQLQGVFYNTADGCTLMNGVVEVV